LRAVIRPRTPGQPGQGSAPGNLEERIMNRGVKIRGSLLLALFAGLGLLAGLRAKDPEPAKPAKAESPIPTWATTAVKPKPLSDNVKKGLAFLIKQQQPDGGWGQGDESAAMGRGLAQFKDKSNVADTCMAILALLRAGHSPREGEYAKNVGK